MMKINKKIISMFLVMFYVVMLLPFMGQTAHADQGISQSFDVSTVNNLENYIYRDTVDNGYLNLRGISIYDGNKYVTSCPGEVDGDGTIYKYTGDGNATAIITGLINPTSVAVSPAGIYVVDADSDAPKVWKYDLNGQNPVQIGTEGTDEEQYSLPYCVDLDNDGNVYITDFNSSKILKFNADGTFSKEISCTDTPCGIAVDRTNGWIYVTALDSYTIKKYNLNLEEQTVTGAEWTNLYCPVSLSVDSAGNVFVLINDFMDESTEENPILNCVKKFNSSGKLLATFGATGTDNGQFYADGNIVTDTEGNVYVTDVTSRIQKFTVEQQETEVTTPSAVTIEGTTRAGNTLEAQLVDENESAFTTSAAVTYKWYRLENSGDQFSDQVGSKKTYTLTNADLNKYIGVRATYDGNDFDDVTGKILNSISNGGSSSSSNNSGTSSSSSSHHSSSSSSSSSSSKSSTERIIVNVTDGSNDKSISQTVIERTTASDGTKKDTVTYTADKAKQTIAALVSQGKDTLRIVATDTDPNVSEIQVNIPKDTLEALSSGNVNLEIETGGAIISVPKESLQDLYKNGQLTGDLYFTLVPIKDKLKQQEIKTTANQQAVIKAVSGDNGVQVLGMPMTIKTNMSQRAVDIILPLTGINIPTDATEREAFSKDLGVFIEHSDGEKVLEKGQVVEYAAGVLGIKFTVNKFSDFTIVKLNQKIQTGWKLINGDWYFYKKDGTMAKGWYQSESADWIYNGKDIVGQWFHLETDGKMDSGWFKDTDGSWYFLCDGKSAGALGAMETGWKLIDGIWYLLRDNGSMATGWQQVNGKWYYLYSDGSMASNTVINGYTVNENGAWTE